jgi:hypothetical protein
MRGEKEEEEERILKGDVGKCKQFVCPSFYLHFSLYLPNVLPPSISFLGKLPSVALSFLPPRISLTKFIFS